MNLYQPLSAVFSENMNPTAVNTSTFTLADAMANAERLFDAARKAGVRRIVHISIANPSEDSPLEYYRRKEQDEKMLIETGLSYAIVRPAILTAFLGYLLVIVGLMYDLGRPLQIWHAIIMWNPRSVMFEVAWCVMLYTTVLALEFAPIVLERLKMVRTIAVLGKLTIPIIILGVLLSTLHQSSLGSLYLIVPYKLYPLWYSPMLPVFFWVSAIAVGCAMVIFESFLSARAFKRGHELHLLRDVARISVLMLAVYLVMQFIYASRVRAKRREADPSGLPAEPAPAKTRCSPSWASVDYAGCRIMPWRNTGGSWKAEIVALNAA